MDGLPKLPRKPALSQIEAVDLFCGAGGLSYGMQRAGISIVGGIDLDPACRHPFEANVDAKFYAEDVAEVSASFLASLYGEGSRRVLAGCAPCQPYSTYSNNNSAQTHKWQLLSHFGELVGELRPDVVTMENVPQLERYPVFREFVNTLEQAGYGAKHQIVKCVDYGIPQNRKRLVLLASRHGGIELTLPPQDAGKALTVEDAIGRLPRIDAGEALESDPLHRASRLSALNLRRIQASQPGGSWRDWTDDLRASCHARESGGTYGSVYGRMRWDAPAPTITTQFNGYGNGRFGHPEQDRAISLREGAILQTFPEDYSFLPPGQEVQMTSIARLIGNAVPVRLGEAIGKSIAAHLEMIG